MFNSRECDKLMAAKRAVTGTAQTFLRSKQVLTYEDFKRIMLKEFDETLTQREVYTLLQNRKKKPEESLKRYIAIMEEIASRANLADIDLIDCIIAGIGDKSQQTSML